MDSCACAASLRVPEGVEVGRARRRQSDPGRCHCGADRVQPGVASSIATHEARALAHWRCGCGRQVRVGFNRDVDHPGLVADDLDRGLAAREIQRALLEHHGVVAANRPLVRVGRCRGTWRHRPADRLADVVGAVRVIRREHELLLNRTAALCGHRPANERENHEQARGEPNHADTPRRDMPTVRDIGVQDQPLTGPASARPRRPGTPASAGAGGPRAAGSSSGPD